MKFRKKPVVIDAIQYDGGNAAAVLFWIGNSDAAIDAALEGKRLAWVDETGALLIRTLESGEGAHVAAVGDWIIRGVKGEHYPCKPDIFEATYEPADGAAAA